MLQSNYFKDALYNCHGDSKKKWRVIKQFWPFLKKESSIRDINGSTDNANKVKSVNEYFINIANTFAAQIDDNDNYIALIEVVPYAPVFEFMTLTPYDTAVLIHDLKPSSSCGVDGLTA